MRHRILWPLVATLSLGVLILFIARSTAQRAGGGVPGGPMPGMPGAMHGMPGRFVVANASASQVLILDTATGQVYRAKEEDFKKMSDLPHMGHPGGGREAQPPGRDRRPEPKDNEEARPRDRRPPAKDKIEERPPARDRRPPEKDAPKDRDQAPPRREGRE